MDVLALLLGSSVSIGVRDPAAEPMPCVPEGFIEMRLAAVGAVAAVAGERSSGHTT